MKRGIAVMVAAATYVFSPAAVALNEAVDAAAVVRAAVDYWRDDSSYTESEMLVHRPTWERAMEMVGWTKGMNQSLIRFTAPAKDAGSASLTIDDDVWSYSPKINRVIRIPASMKSQSWMGSDFSYRDLARADDIVDQYRHRLLETRQADGHTVYVIEAVPLENAPVVWGKEVLHIRDDKLLLRHQFYDQDGKLVKELEAKEITTLGGKLYPSVMRMTNVEQPAEWTEVRTTEASFDVDVPERVFTLSNLRNPRNR